MNPTISPLDEVVVEGRGCVVVSVFSEPTINSGIAIVVYNPDKPTTREIGWDGSWKFVDVTDFGGYGQESDPAVVKLRRLSGWRLGRGS